MRFIDALESRLHFDGGAGAIDPTFGASGTAVGDISTVLPANWPVDKRWLAQDSGGRIYAMVYSPDQNADGIYRLVIARFTRDGQIDTKFNGSGYKYLDGASQEGTNAYYIHLFVDQNNRAYVMDGPVIWRLTPGGRADQTFGRRGKTVPPFLADDPDNRLPLAMAFDADGRAYVGGNAVGNKRTGSALEKNATRMAVIRLTENGAWDTTWGYQGIYKSPVKTGGANTVSSGATVVKMRFMGDGKLMIAGTYRYSVAGPNYPAFPAVGTNATWTTRLDSGGNVDTGYGTDGYAEDALTDVWTQAGAPDTSYWVQPMAVNPDGSVIGVITINPATQDSSGGSNFRIAPDGKSRVDNLPIAPSGFVQQFGIKKIDGPIAVQSDGDIVGRRGSDAVLFRSNLDNTIDTSFGDNGFTTFSDSPLDDVQLAPDGSFITMNRASSPGAQTFNIHRLFRDDAPLAQLDAPFVRAPRTTAIRLAVTYRDDDGMKQSSIGSGDLRVTGPFDGATRTRSVSIESVTALDGGRFLAIYKLTSPNGWSAIDNGYYTVRLSAGEVEDINGVAAGARTLGMFRVKIA